MPVLKGTTNETRPVGASLSTRPAPASQASLPAREGETHSSARCTKPFKILSEGCCATLISHSSTWAGAVIGPWVIQWVPASSFCA
jgi:hypothetical protein